MGATESSYRKLGAKMAKLQCVPRQRVESREQEAGQEDTKEDRKGKRKRNESLFAHAQWSRRRGSDVAEWPAWYHGWCRRAEVGEGWWVLWSFWAVPWVGMSVRLCLSPTCPTPVTPIPKCKY